MRGADRAVTAAPSRPAGQVLHAVGLGLLLAAAWGAVWLAGGTHTALPHIFYVPIVLAALPFGVRGAVVVGLAATVACGPLMPLEVATMQMQSAANWLARGGFFVATGVSAGSILIALRHRFERRLTRWFGRELNGTPPPEAGLSAGRVQTMLATRAFHPVFQPIYALDDGRLLAVEALTRFEGSPPLPPGVWFAAADEAGLGVDLEVATLSVAIDAVVDCPRHVALSLNVSPALLADPRLLRLLDGANGRPLVVEVTEHAVVEDYPSLHATMARLRERGVRLAVDDIGAGFASLRHVVRLHPDQIKVDISLTQGLHRDPIRRGLARALVEFATQADVQLVAEGIDHPHDLTAWQELGAHAAQGFLLARPGPLPVAPCCSLIADPWPVTGGLLDYSPTWN